MLRMLSLSLLLAGCARTTQLRALGSVDPKQLCPDVQRCDARGDATVSTLRGRKAQPIYLGARQGPESYLGKVAPERKASSVLKTCGGDVTRDDWLVTAPARRPVSLPERGVKELRELLRNRLAEALDQQPKLLDDTGLTVAEASKRAAQQLRLTPLELTSQTYWLSDSAFEKRLGQCGEEEYENIIYSITLLSLADLARKELATQLCVGLESLWSAPARAAESEPTSSEEQSVEKSLDALATHEVQGDDLVAQARAAESEAAAAAVARQEQRKKLSEEACFRAADALASELRIVAALGFDEQ